MGENRFHGFSVVGMIFRKGDDQTSSRTTGKQKLDEVDKISSPSLSIIS